MVSCDTSLINLIRILEVKYINMGKENSVQLTWLSRILYVYLQKPLLSTNLIQRSYVLFQDRV